MLQRKIMKTLINWKESSDNDCLVIRGVRQCGKTYIVREFAKSHYENTVEINFIERPEMKQAFDGSLDVDTMIQGITLLSPDLKFVPGKTLLFLDEIQECPSARTSLKFWAQDSRYDVIATGSLLGIDYKDIVSIPVGYETQIDMYPLGIENNMLDSLSDYTDGSKAVPAAIHSAMMQHLREYLVIGGMPDVVNTYLESKDYQRVQMIQDKILRDYQDDIAKYADNSVRIKAKGCFLSIPRQLTKDNHKFQYSVIENKGTARKFESSLDWLRSAGMIVHSYNVSLPAFPLTAYVKESQFRIYLCDIGLFSAMFGYQLKAAILSDTLEGPAKGGIYESLIADIFYKNGQSLYYYKKDDSTLEIEFLLERDAHAIPVEVKAKKGSSKSLNELLKSSQIPVGYKFTAQNAGRVNKKITLPLYLAAFL